MFISLLLFLFSSLQDSTERVVVESAVELFQSAACFSLTPDGNSFVIDQKRNSLRQISEKGITTKSVGGHGLGSYEFDNPTDVSSSFLLDVYVTDFNNRRIQRYDKNLNYVQTYDESTLPQEVGSFQPRAAIVSSQGDLFVVEVDGKRIVKLDKRNRLVREFGTYKDGAGALTEPADIAISPADEIFVLDRSKIIAYDLFGNYLRTISLPESDWKNIQVFNNSLMATASGQIFIRSLADGEQITLAHAMIIGIPSKEHFIDAAFDNDSLVILTLSTLYYCSITR